MLYGEGSIPTGVADHPSFYDSTDGSEGWFQLFKQLSIYLN